MGAGAVDIAFREELSWSQLTKSITEFIFIYEIKHDFFSVCDMKSIDEVAGAAFMREFILDSGESV